MTIQETTADPGDPVREPPRSKPRGPRGRLPGWRPVLGLAMTAVAIVALAGSLVLVKAPTPTPTTVAGGSPPASPTEPTPTASIPPMAEPVPTWAGGSPSAPPAEPTPTDQPTPTERPTPTPSGGNVFIVTGPLAFTRTGASMTRLNDGRVLVAGGIRIDEESVLGPIASAEIYDPATGKFTQTGSMGEARVDHTATLLKDGRVLIAGGLYQPDPEDSRQTFALETAEVFDPASGTFSNVGPMLDKRVGHSATLLGNGRVLIAGGSIPPETILTEPPTGPLHEVTLAAAELFDPATNRFTRTGPMTAARTGQAAVRLLDGRVLLAGGSVTKPYGDSDMQTDLASAELYDPSSGRFMATGSMTVARARPVAVTLSDGRPLILGGPLGATEYSPTASTPVEVYEPARGTFGTVVAKGPAIVAAAVTLADGHVLVVNAIVPQGLVTPASDVFCLDLVFDVAKRVFSLAGRNDRGSSGSETAVLLTNGDVLICGSDATLIYRP